VIIGNLFASVSDEIYWRTVAEVAELANGARLKILVSILASNGNHWTAMAERPAQNFKMDLFEPFWPAV